MGRPRKYATDAERAAAYRDRYAILNVRVRTEQAVTLDKIAAARDESRADLLQQLISFALANANWYEMPRFSRSIVQAPQTRRRETKFMALAKREEEDDA
jgi:hypothetical protein